KQIELANRYEKPLIVHIREASDISKQLLCRYANVGGVLHCYNASEHLLDLADNGFYFGIGGVLTFKNAKKIKEVLPKIPLEKLVVETDAPYLTPHPHRGSRNEPSYIPLIVASIAQLRGLDISQVETILRENTNRLFKEFKQLK
ncbi:MAG: TatD family hydrolase, partial [Campylobacterota bacterium]